MSLDALIGLDLKAKNIHLKTIKLYKQLPLEFKGYVQLLKTGKI